MNKNIDQLFKEKFENLEIQPKPASKDIFLQKAVPENPRPVYKFSAIAAAAIIIFLTGTFFLLNVLKNTSQVTTSNTNENEKITYSNTENPSEDFHDTNNQAAADTFLIAHKTRIKQIISAQHEVTREYDSADAYFNYIYPSEKQTIIPTEHVALSAPELEIRITGLFEQMMYYAESDANQKQPQITLQLLNQKIVVQSPVIDEVDQLYHQLKKEVKDFTLSDAGRTISNQLFTLVSPKKNQLQNK